MKRYIDADALLERMEVRLKQLRTEYGDYDHYTDGFDEGLVAVEDAPTADVVEVVRCKDCKHCEYRERYEGLICHCAKGIVGVVNEDDFCSYGEKEKENKDGRQDQSEA